MNKQTFMKSLKKELDWKNVTYSMTKDGLLNVQGVLVDFNKNVVTIDDDITDWNKSFTPNMLILSRDKILKILENKKDLK